MLNMLSPELSFNDLVYYAEFTMQTTGLVSFKRHITSILSTILLISWVTLLTTYTVLLQNSCTPLLEWTDLSARDCPTSSPQTRKLEGSKIAGIAGGNTPQILPPIKAPTSDASKEIIALAAGSVAVAGFALIEAPIVVIAGVGLALWLAARTVLASGR
jgi:hypothetical protein